MPAAARPLLALLTVIPLALPATAAQARGVDISLGDSVAAGAGVDHPWPAIVFAGLRRPAAGGLDDLENLARSGATSRDIRAQQVPDAIKLIDDPATNTKFVTVQTGGNDRFACGTQWNAPACPVRTNLTSTLDSLAPALRADPGREVVLVVGYYNPAAGTGTQAERDYDLALLGTDGRLDCAGTGDELGGHDILACVAAQRGWSYTDAYAVMKAAGQADIQPDGLHPDQQGHQAIADAVLGAYRASGGPSEAPRVAVARAPRRAVPPVFDVHGTINGPGRIRYRVRYGAGALDHSTRSLTLKGHDRPTAVTVRLHLRPGQTYRYRLEATGPYGDVGRSGLRAVTTQR